MSKLSGVLNYDLDGNFRSNSGPTSGAYEILYEMRDSASICPGDSIWIGTRFVDQPGNYLDTLHVGGVADTIFQLHLDIYPAPAPYLGSDSIICQGDSAGSFPLWVKVGNKEGCLGSDTIEITVDVCTFLEEKTSRDYGIMKIFPNPAMEEVLLEVPEARGSLLIEVTNNLGREILQKRIINYSHPVRIPIESFSSGIYNVFVVGNDGVSGKGRFIKK